jgi:ABC-type glutathione transport system ATPase component
VIRDSLTIPEDRDEFDREYRRALATAAETMELAGVHAMLEQWRRRAWVTHDLEVYQRMMDRVERLRPGEALSSGPVEEVRAVIRERLSL